VLNWLHTKFLVCFQDGHKQLLGQENLSFSPSPHELWKKEERLFSWKQNSQRQIYSLARGWGNCTLEVSSLFFWCIWECKESLPQMNAKDYWKYFKQQSVKRTDWSALPWLMDSHLLQVANYQENTEENFIWLSHIWNELPYLLL